MKFNRKYVNPMPDQAEGGSTAWSYRGLTPLVPPLLYESHALTNEILLSNKANKAIN